MGAPATTSPGPRRVSFPRGAWLGLVLFGLLLVGGIFAQLAVVSKQLDTNNEQRSLIERQVRETLPLVERTDPLVRQTLENLPQTERTSRRVEQLTAAATPLVDELRRAGLDSSARAVQALVATLLRADVGTATTAARDLADDLLRIGPGDVLARTSDAVERTSNAASVIPRQLRVQLRTLAVQRRALGVQQRTLALAEQLLAVALETEKHAESLDRKTLGSP